MHCMFRLLCGMVRHSFLLFHITYYSFFVFKFNRNYTAHQLPFNFSTDTSESVGVLIYGSTDHLQNSWLSHWQKKKQGWARKKKITWTPFSISNWMGTIRSRIKVHYRLKSTFFALVGIKWHLDMLMLDMGKILEWT